MSALQLKNDLLKYILDIDDKVILLKVLMYAKETSAENKPKNLTQFRGSIKTGLTVEQIDQQLKEIRSEWERDIY